MKLRRETLEKPRRAREPQVGLGGSPLRCPLTHQSLVDLFECLNLPDPRTILGGADRARLTAQGHALPYQLDDSSFQLQDLGRILLFPTGPSLFRSIKEASRNRRFRLALGGHFKPPTTGHQQRVEDFTRGLVDALGAESVALFTSPSTTAFDDGRVCLDHLATRIASENDLPVVHFTTLGYLTGADPRQLSPGVQPTYRDTLKIVLDHAEAYAWAEISSASATLATGGRLAMVSDFVKSVKLGKPVVLAFDSQLTPITFDPDRRSPSDATGYLWEMVSTLASLVAEGRSPEALADPSNYPHPFMPDRGLTPEFFASHAKRVGILAVSVDIGSDELVPRAVETSRAHLESRVPQPPGGHPRTLGPQQG